MRAKSSRIILVAFWALLIAAPVRAQSTEPSQDAGGPMKIDLGESAVALTDWKFHPGDDPAYALPGYDDSDWRRMDLRGHAGSHDPNYSSETFVPGWTARGFPALTGFAWYRTRFRVTGIHRDLWLAMPPNVDDVYQVYANGKLVGAFGTFTAHHARALASHSMKFHLPPPDAEGDMLLALRFYMQPDTPLWNPQAGGLHAWPELGLGPTIALIDSRNSSVGLKTFLFYLLLGIVLVMAGIAALWIYWIDRREKAYLWLTLALLTGAAAALNEFAGNIGQWQRISLTQVLLVRDFAETMLAPVFWILFWACWFRLRHLGMVFRIAWGLVLAEICAFACMRHYLLASWVPPTWAHPVLVASIVLRFAVALLLLAVVIEGIRQQPAEGWIALPAILLLGIALFAQDMQLVGVQVVYFPLGIAVNLNSIAWVVLAVVVIGLVLRRFLHTQVQEQEMAQEMAQAHAVQTLLVPEQLPQTAGYRVDGTYIPASQVGGDFYQVLPVTVDGKQNGGAILVLGDVSGKGLRAAMVVSMAVGAVRAIVKDTSEPAEVLERLNREVAGHLKSGFITCLCMRLDSDGTVTLANAGHLPPWLNGQEVSTPGTLPLGMMAAAKYESLSFRLKNSDVLVVMSDGIVEARSEKERELYGFERLARLLAGKPTAEEIATVAQRFGQEDDISVVSIARVEESLHAVPVAT